MSSSTLSSSISNAGIISNAGTKSHCTKYLLIGKAPARGVTLIELLISLTIFITILGYGFPGLTHLLKSNRAATTMNWLIGSIQYTRHTAITLNTLTTICPSTNGSACGGKWHEGTIVFTDFNADAKVNGRDKILRRFNYPEKGSTLRWRAFRNRQYLQMTNWGFTKFQNGNFVYCSADRDAKYSRQIVINMQGRIRKSYDKDGDGLVDDSRGRALRC